MKRDQDNPRNVDEQPGQGKLSAKGDSSNSSMGIFVVDHAR